jgi:hypothetical protein
MRKFKLNLVWGFKRKLYGWGWVPVRWQAPTPKILVWGQGWGVIAGYLLLVLGVVSMREEAIPGNPDSGSNFLVFALPIIILMALLIYICYKTGERPRWQWGVPKKD